MTQALGNLFIIAAPSGAGKSTLVNALLKVGAADPTDFSLCNSPELSVSHTTRAPREGEMDGVQYHFVSVAEFKALIDENAFYEYAEVFGNYYGTSRQAIADKLQQGIDIFLDIDWQGARQVKALNNDVVSIFILPPSIEALRERLIGRGQDSPEVIENRMQKAVSEMSHYNEFDYVIVNDDFDTAVQGLLSIVNTQSHTLAKQSVRYADLLGELVLS